MTTISLASPRAYEFACHSKACAPPPAGVGGSKGGGGGSNTRLPIVKPRSIGHVSTARLNDSLDQIHDTTHTKSATLAHDDTRRTLINRGIKGKIIADELQRRGEAPRTCRFCAPNPPHIGRFTFNEKSKHTRDREAQAAATAKAARPRTQASRDAEARQRAKDAARLAA